MKKKAFELFRVSGQPASDAQLLDDLRCVAASLGKTTIGQKEYRRARHDDSTTTRRFGSWNGALKAAGLSVSNVVDLCDEELFENILALWQHYGRQPRQRELALPPSRISQSPYLRRFRSWTAVPESFVSFANANVSGNAQATGTSSASEGGRRTSRDPYRRSVQFSFATKLFHMLFPDAPVYDSCVAAFYLFSPPAATLPT